MLQLVPIEVATNRNVLHLMETNLYALLYAHLSPGRATDGQQCRLRTHQRLALVREVGGGADRGPSGAAVEALARVMAADLEGSPVTVNLLLPGGPTDTSMVPDDTPAKTRKRLLDAEIMGRPIVWLASPEATGVHDERIVAAEFELECPRFDGQVVS